MKVEISPVVQKGVFARVAADLQKFIERNCAEINERFTLPSTLLVSIQELRDHQMGIVTGKAIERWEGRQRSYELQIDPRAEKRDGNFRDLIVTLFHELTHIDQYFSGRMKCLPGYRIWTTQYQTTRIKESHDWDSYWNSPWEVEARARSTEEVERYITAGRIQSLF